MTGQDIAASSSQRPADASKQFRLPTGKLYFLWLFLQFTFGGLPVSNVGNAYFSGALVGFAVDLMAGLISQSQSGFLPTFIRIFAKWLGLMLLAALFVIFVGILLVGK